VKVARRGRGADDETSRFRIVGVAGGFICRQIPHNQLILLILIFSAKTILDITSLIARAFSTYKG
jgi:hypothetical protein